MVSRMGHCFYIAKLIVNSQSIRIFKIAQLTMELLTVVVLVDCCSRLKYFGGFNHQIYFIQKILV